MKHIYIFNQMSKGSQYGVGTYIEQLTNLKNYGFSIHIVFLNSDVNQFSVFLKDNIEIFFFPNPVLVPLREISLENYHMNVIRILCQHINHENDNIFHLNYLDSHILAKYIKKYTNGKIVLTIHYNQSVLRLKGNISRLYEVINSQSKEEPPIYKVIRREINTTKQMIIKYIDKVISITNHSFSLNKNLYEIEEKKNALIYNTLNDYSNTQSSPKKEIKERLGIFYTGKIIIFAGRLDENKGLQCLLQALAILKKKDYDFHLFIAGKGEFEKTIHFVKDLYTNITFTGFLNKEELYELFSISDIGVVPSLYEEFGYVVLEMMIHKLPIVAYDSSGPAEIIEDGKTGLLAKLLFNQPEQSIQNLADKIEYLLSHSSESAQMGQSGYQRFITKFSINNFIEQMNNLYLSL